MPEHTEMLFEGTMMMFFGKKAYQTASQHNTPRHRREWLVKFAKLTIKRIDKIDANSEQKMRLIALLNKFVSELKLDKEPSWQAFYCLVKLSGGLLGYDAGCIIYDPVYVQSRNQYYTSLRGDPLQSYDDKKNCIKIRLEVVKRLQEQLLSKQMIAIVLNTSEYQIKKLLREAG